MSPRVGGDVGRVRPDAGPNSALRCHGPPPKCSHALACPGGRPCLCAFRRTSTLTRPHFPRSARSRPRLARFAENWPKSPRNLAEVASEIGRSHPSIGHRGNVDRRAKLFTGQNLRRRVRLNLLSVAASVGAGGAPRGEHANPTTRDISHSPPRRNSDQWQSFSGIVMAASPGDPGELCTSLMLPNGCRTTAPGGRFGPNSPKSAELGQCWPKLANFELGRCWSHVGRRWRCGPLRPKSVEVSQMLVESK